jgi:hypothetical protein
MIYFVKNVEVPWNQQVFWFPYIILLINAWTNTIWDLPSNAQIIIDIYAYHRENMGFQK